VNRYKELRRQFRQEAAAAMVGISVRSARRIEETTTLPSQRGGVRRWRTRADPLAGAWETELVPLLHQTPHCPRLRPGTWCYDGRPGSARSGAVGEAKR
jgi:hypothetical protein